MVSLLLVLLAELLLAPVAPSLLVLLLLLQVGDAPGTAAAAGDAPGTGAEGAEQAIHLARLRHFKRTEKSPRLAGL